MSIKKLFELLKSYNTLCTILSTKDHYFRVYFDGFESIDCYNYTDFWGYILSTYVDEYISIMEKSKGHSHSQYHSVWFEFECNGEHHTIEFFLY